MKKYLLSGIAFAAGMAIAGAAMARSRSASRAR